MKQEKHFVVDILFVLALFGVFTISALVLVTIGADVYQHTVRDMSRNYDNRTAIAYITEKVRRFDGLLEDFDEPDEYFSAVEIDTLEGQPALVLNEMENADLYCTYLYLHDGWLKELYMKKGANLGDDMLSAGQKILQLDSLSYTELSDNLLKIDLKIPDVGTRSLFLKIRCR